MHSSSNQQIPAIIKLNVGGSKFCTSYTTLLNLGDNFLAALVFNHYTGGILTPVDEEGYLFIDRSPTCFAVILDYLRTSQIHKPPNVPQSLIDVELQYYGLLIPPPKILSNDSGACSELRTAYRQYLESPTSKEQMWFATHGPSLLAALKSEAMKGYSHACLTMPHHVSLLCDILILGFCSFGHALRKFQYLHSTVASWRGRNGQSCCDPRVPNMFISNSQ